MKKSILALILVVYLALPKPVLAQEEVCVQVYGGGVVCGAKHEVVDTDLGDVNPVVLGTIFLLASFGLFRLSKKLSCQSVSF
jgi:hypothetical protein